MSNSDKKSKELFSEIISDIKSGKYKEGSLLPSEEQICKKYKVGRSTVREALKVLEILNIVDIRVGIGTSLKKLSVDFLFQPTAMLFSPDLDFLLDLLEFRKFFEKIVLEIVIQKISEKEIDELQEILDHSDFYYQRKNIEKFSEFDFMFHEILSKQTKNIIIISLFTLIYPYLRYTIPRTLDEKEMSRSLNSHKEILKYIKKMDNKGALEALNKHIEEVGEVYKKSFQKKFNNSEKNGSK